MYRSVRSFIADARHNRLLLVPAVSDQAEEQGG